MSGESESKLCSADEAVRWIESGDTVACGGFVGAAHPEGLTAALERRFLEEGSPRDLTLVYAAGQGDGANRGLNHLAHEALLKRVVGGHWGLAPKLGELAIQNKIEAYNFPQGVICALFREIAAGRPGCITPVGLGTCVDPNLQGGRLNQCSSEALIDRIKLDGNSYLFYKSFPIDVALIRGTVADRQGNISMENEAVIGEVLPIAQAVRNSGGTVIVQVKRCRDTPIDPQAVAVPGILVDHIVLANEGEHDQTFAEQRNTSYYEAAPAGEIPPLEPVPPGVRRIIAARACDELNPGEIANLGIGIPEGVGRIASERGILNDIVLTVESGPIGGVPAGGLSFGASAHPRAVVDQPAQFDFYDGGGLDFAALGAAQVDRRGNVNVSRFGNRLAGVGGFINISQNAKRVIFCGTMTSGELEVSSRDGKLTIEKEGRTRKFVEEVEQISFSGQLAATEGRDILYVTERAVFRLVEGGLQLIEIAPGIDLETGVLAVMEFKPVIKDLKEMASNLFSG